MPVREPTGVVLSDDDYDELVSENEDVDEEVKPSLSNDGNVLLRGSLQRPRYSTVNPKHLHDLIHTGVIELDAAYQRDIVWSEIKMIGLIQSIFLNYYIPPIIFAVMNRESEVEELRVCIDGKQRCTSILRFMDGQIPFVSPNTKERFWYNKYGNQNRGKQLPEGLKRRFEQITLQVVEYDNIKDAQQRDIFQRVQLGVALSAPEKLQAIPGPWTEWILELQKKYVSEPNTLSEKMTWEQTRGRPFQAITAFIILAFDPSRQSQPSYPNMTKFLERFDSPDPCFKRKVEMALSLFVNIVTNHYADAFQTTTTERVAPVEFWFIALFIFNRMGSMSLDNLAMNIGEMRREIRSHYRDIRANNVVIKSLHSWLAKVATKKRQAGEQVAAEEYEGDNVDMREKRAMKRSRQQEVEDPSYLGVDAALPRGAAGSAPATRAKIPKTAPVKVEPARPARISVPTTTVARPPPSAMDAAPNMVPGSFGQSNPSVNPYTQAYTVGSTQRLNGNQSQPNRSAYPPPYQQPPQSQQRPYTPQEIANFNVMRAAQQKPQVSQWSSNQPYGR